MLEWWQTTQQGVPGTFAIKVGVLDTRITEEMYQELTWLIDDARPVMPTLAVDDRPPISIAGASAVYDSHDTYQITIAAASGMDMQMMEKSLRAMLNKIDCEKRARQPSKLSD